MNTSPTPPSAAGDPPEAQAAPPTPRSPRPRVVVIGGGIVGLAVARELQARGSHVTVCEKEDHWAAHQTGHNSQVAHSGAYYAPGSHKALLAVAGNRSIVAYARSRGVAVDVCGKLIVATTPAELPGLQTLAARAAANGVPARLIGPPQAREFEPHVSCLQALHIESTAAVDFPGVCARIVDELTQGGADLRLAAPALDIRHRGSGVEVATPHGTVRADRLVNCAGLHADRIATMAGLRPPVQIVPFRGEYYQLRPAAQHLVRGLIYPVPDPTLPFLGVHLTRMLDGTVHAGPNAVLALGREGYRWRDVCIRDLASAARYPGLWRLAKRYPHTAVSEVARSLSQRRFARSLARLVPAIGAGDVVRAGSGVRAQALRPDGTLVDDFLLVRARNQVHVLNAPSPAATAALDIGRRLADQVLEN
ncbi:L-2-hydroxyglutarate oxidase [Streptomyces pinistramenti]|uniref:L-2-hydroxyglutarate oxidase n=1 Tax=Streptomyces pinistramenti TaxID=2884812 RepID=UPI001D08852C|nr:L-2-hydroxyglutarate oxidase [Streptomyces pinistramenti]MCB5910426.1 L-2-hydroxyglutarate oxidase [Streptomyces pinistramenti]